MTTNKKIKVGCFALIDPFRPLAFTRAEISQSAITMVNNGGLRANPCTRPTKNFAT